jgi:hypothetical protein
MPYIPYHGRIDKMADDLFDALAAALEAAADVLRNWGTADDDTTSATTEAATELHGTVEERARQQHPQIGDRQLDMLPLLEAAGTAGISRGDIARTLGYDGPNAGIALKGLKNAGVVEVVDTHDYPRLWRLTRAMLT